MALLALGTALVLSHKIAPEFGTDRLQISNLYGAVFNWSAIQSGFVFGIYGFVISKKDGFVGDIAEGLSFPRFVRYTRGAYLLAMILTIVSLPLIVVEPSVGLPLSSNYLLISGWFALFVWTFFAFLRVAFIFGSIAATPDRKSKLPG